MSDKFYIVEVQEVHVQKIAIKASSPENALDDALSGSGVQIDESTYDYTLDDRDAHKVFEADEQELKILGVATEELQGLDED